MVSLAIDIIVRNLDRNIHELEHEAPFPSLCHNLLGQPLP